MDAWTGHRASIDAIVSENTAVFADQTDVSAFLMVEAAGSFHAPGL